MAVDLFARISPAWERKGNRWSTSQRKIVFFLYTKNSPSSSVMGGRSGYTSSTIFFSAKKKPREGKTGGRDGRTGWFHLAGEMGENIKEKITFFWQLKFCEVIYHLYIYGDSLRTFWIWSFCVTLCEEQGAKWLLGIQWLSNREPSPQSPKKISMELPLLIFVTLLVNSQNPEFI